MDLGPTESGYEKVGVANTLCPGFFGRILTLNFTKLMGVSAENRKDYALFRILCGIKVPVILPPSWGKA